MNSAIERLLSLRVEDVMSRKVVQLNAGDTMAEAARVFDQHDISGAPVVDEQGRCVGVLTGSDFIMRERTQAAVDEHSHPEVEHVLVQDRPDGPYHIEEISENLVSNHMTAAVQAVAKSSSILDAARIMCAEHIHRLVVLDEAERPAGLVSSLDLVAAMVKSIEE